MQLFFISVCYCEFGQFFLFLFVSIYFNIIFNLLSIIYINLNFYIFTKNFNLTIKLTKYKTNFLNKPLFILSQNTKVKNSTQVSSIYKRKYNFTKSKTNPNIYKLQIHTTNLYEEKP